MTVLGPVPASDLGHILPHEHLLIDGRCYYTPPAEANRRAIAESPVDITKLGLLRRNLFALRDNLDLSDIDQVCEEALEFCNLGGRTIVELTLPDVGRDPIGLQTISRRTGLHIVMGCGHYIHPVHPRCVDEETVEEVTKRLICEINNGVKGSGVRPGIIGEIGTWDPLHPNEEKVLRAAAHAQKATGLALTIHLHIAARKGADILTILDQEGVDLSRVVLGHLDIAFGHLNTDFENVIEYHTSLAASGCYIEYDTCGTEVFSPKTEATPPFWTALDLTRARGIARLVEQGFGDQILISHDIFTKSQLIRYGGFGYGHILRDFQYRLLEVGLSEGEVRKLLVDNPRRMLTPSK
jgi:phosphotriesterase-related protein